MSYIDGFVIAVPTANKQAMLDHARFMDPMFIEWGAVRVVEAWGDDVPDGKQTDFKRAVAARPDETVCFSWIEWPDKATRDAGWAAVMADERMKGPDDPPMAGPRIIYGGFETILDTAANP
jgi:uncharacterized protein YbaA (DUF1428 family)